jgi:hypothetical protein
MEAKELFEMFGLQDRSGVFADAECILNLELALYAHAMCYNECALQHYSAALAVSTRFPLILEKLILELKYLFAEHARL